MLRAHLEKLFDAFCLSEQEAREAMAAVLSNTNTCQTAALLALMKYRGETATEITGMAKALLRDPIVLKQPALDIVGTGGDRAKTVNLSTGAAILTAACGVPVAKHGGRSVSSLSGSADVLEAFGIDLAIPIKQVQPCLDFAGITYLFAPHFYPCLKDVSTIRQMLKFPTVFNTLLCLVNPAHVENLMVGVASELALDVMAQAIVRLGIAKRALVFHGNGIDEVSTLGSVQARYIRADNIQAIEINPSDFGFEKCCLADLQGGDAHNNAQILREVFAGRPSPVADSIILTSACALKLTGQVGTVQEGVCVARQALSDGKAQTTLNRLIEFGGTYAKS